MKTSLKTLAILLLTSFMASTIYTAQIVQTIETEQKSNTEVLHTIWRAIARNNIDKVRDLLPNIASSDLNISNYRGYSPLTEAACHGLTEIMKILIEHGADVNAKDKNGKTPLVLASGSHNIEIAQLLIQHHADVNTRTDDGVAPIMNTHKPEIVQLLIDFGADVNMKNSHSGGTALMHAAQYDLLVANVLLVNNADINTQDKNGRTALMLAVIFDNPRMVRLLLSAGADLNIKNEKDSHKKAIDYGFRRNRTWIQQAVKDGKTEYRYYQQLRKLVEEQSQLIPVIARIVYNYAFGEVPANLQVVEEEHQSTAFCSIQ